MTGSIRLLAAVLCVLAIQVPAPLCAQAPSADRRGPRQVADSLEIARFARTLTAAAGTDSARAAAVYEWIARNLSYDVAGYLAGGVEGAVVEEVWRTRTAVCDGYVALFQRLAGEVGLRVRRIEGYAKGFDYRHGQSTKRPNHAWVAVSMGGHWRLLDPTWGSGVIEHGRFERRFTWDYFLVDPEALVLSHLPVEQSWQLLDRPVSRRDFERMPAVPRNLVNAGYAPGAIRRAVLLAGVRDFPLVGLQPGFRVLSAPMSGTLRREEHVEVDLVWPGVTEVALVSGGVWTPLVRDGDRFRGVASAPADPLSLVGRRGADDAFATALYWRVR